MPYRLDWLNEDCKRKSLEWRNDFSGLRRYHHGMALPIRNFYLSEWLRYYDKSQAQMARDLEWNKAKVSLLCSGKQEFYRSDLFEAADYLNLEPYELLMHPDNAMNLRRLVSEMKRLAGAGCQAGRIKETEEARKAKQARHRNARLIRVVSYMLRKMFS